MKKVIFAIFSCLLFVLFVVQPVQAQLKGGAFQQYTKGEGGVFTDVYETEGKLEESLPQAVGNVISIALSFIGVILLIIIVYAGFLWLTAGGSEEQVGKAKKLIKNGVIGVAIALSAFIITSFVVRSLESSIGAGSTPASTPAPGVGGGSG